MTGFRFQLHSPYELSPFDDFISISPGQHLLIAIKPKMVTTSYDLRKYDPDKRGCYFSTERKLRFFKQYNQQKCEIECLANFTKNECSCVQFWMPSDVNKNVFFT